MLLSLFVMVCKLHILIFFHILILQGILGKAEYRLSGCYGALVLINRLNKTKSAVLFLNFRLVLFFSRLFIIRMTELVTKLGYILQEKKLLQHVRRGLPIHSNDFVYTDALRDSQHFSVILGIFMVEPVLSRG